MPDHVNREEVERRLARLREAYDDPRVIERRREIPPERFESLRAVCERGYVGAGYAWVVRYPEDAPDVTESTSGDDREDEPHVLLVLERQNDEQAWEVPGGGLEAGETFEEGTVREVREETGLDVELDDPFLVYRVEHRPPVEVDEDVHLHMLFTCFDARYVDGPLRVQQEELQGAAWFGDPPGRIAGWAQIRGEDWWDGYEAPERWWLPDDEE